MTARKKLKQWKFADRIEWRKNEGMFQKGQLHREDGPAIEFTDGQEMWFRNGQLHREEGPAATNPSGAESWYVNGKLHRDEGPAVTQHNGAQRWFLNGVEMSEDEFLDGELDHRGRTF